MRYIDNYPLHTSYLLAVQTHHNRYACFALLLWEYLLSFHDEIRLIWRKPWSLATVLFLLSRYVGLSVLAFGVYVNLHVGVICEWWLRVEAAGSLIIMWSVMGILQLRLYGLYSRSRLIRIFLVVGYIVQAVLSVLVYWQAVGSIRVAPYYLVQAPLQNCWPVRASGSLPLYFGPPMAYESILCLLAAWKCWERVRETGTFPFASRALYDILVRDSLAYFVVILATYALNVWAWQAYLPVSLDLMTPFAIAVPSLLGARLLLNVRAAYYDASTRGAGTLPRRPDDISLHVDLSNPPAARSSLAGEPVRGRRPSGDGWLGLARDANPVGTGLFRPPSRESVRSMAPDSIRVVRRRSTLRSPATPGLAQDAYELVCFNSVAPSPLLDAIPGENNDTSSIALSKDREAWTASRNLRSRAPSV